MKRILLSLGIALAFTAGTMAQNVGVGTGTVIEGIFDENIKWQLSSDSILTISGTGELDLDYYLYEFKEAYSSRIKTIIIEDGITSIGYRCFEDFQSLENVSFPKTLINIEHSAFAGCIKLKELIFPEPLTTIGESAFEECTALTSINIPESVTTIGDGAFSRCTKLKEVTLPESLTSIGDWAFGDCNGLKTITIKADIKDLYYVFRDCYNVESLFIIGKNTTIPDGLKFSSVVSITLGDKITEIGYDAFSYMTSLKSINIPESVTSIGDYAFSGCTALESINIPESVTGIGYCAFEYCTALTNVNIPSSITYLEAGLFKGCTSLATIKIPESVTSIGYDVFGGCSSLSSINIPSSVNNFGDDVFKGCISLPVVDNIRYADTYLIGVVDSLQKTYKIKEGTRFIGSRAFECCTEMTELNILETVECVGYHAVAGCSSLTSISIPASVKFIDYGAFGTGSSEIEDWENGVDVTYCLPGLRTVLSLNTTPANAPDKGGDEGYDQGIFSPFTYLHAPLYVPEGSYWTYAYAWGWGLFTNIKEVAMDSEDLESRKAYMIADARGCNYKVFDEKKGRLVNVEYTHSLDEESEGSCWTVLKENGESYLYNLGAKKYAKMDAKGALSLSDTPVNLSISSSENGLSINGNACMLVLNKNIEVDATGIDDIRVVEKTKKDEIYSIDGRRMNNTTKGVNIVNGKKVIIK